MLVSSLTFLATNLNGIGKSVAFAPPHDHVLGLLVGWISYWFWFGIGISLVLGVLLWKILKLQISQLVFSSLAMAIGSLAGMLIAGLSVMILGYNLGLFLSFSISGALYGLSFGLARRLIIRRYMPEINMSVSFSVVGWALGWSMWYLPESFTIETVMIVGFVIVVIAELISLYWLYRKIRQQTVSDN